jgi:dTMP kinase
MNRAPFITFEGGEGAGKSTQIRLLAAHLAAAGIRHIVTREPGGSPGAEEIRQLLVTGAADRWSALSETLLFYAARVDHWQRVIRPALEEGTVVLCDRFADSTIAYQAYAGGMDRKQIETLHDLVLPGVQPDLTLILDLSPEAGLRRAVSRAGAEERFESKGIAFHERLRAGFLDIAARHAARCVVIDANRPVEAVSEAVTASVRQRLKLG